MTSTPSEAEWVIPSSRPPPSWPEIGEIEFRDFDMAYSGNKLVLKNINFQIKGKQKIGVVGRTGAGKSTLMQALFRILDPVEGTILIDKIDTNKIYLSRLRVSLSLIPQDPTLFIGSVRYNLDPFNESSDDDIWNAFKLVQLYDYVSNLPEKLESLVEEGGRNFSLGQRQLMCMARALLRKSKILLLDEATAAVDVETDAIIQNTIRKAFANCTVITIAHRLNTIMDCDKVLVLEKGEIAEYDSTKKLIATGGIFYELVQAAGAKSAEHLTYAADRAFKRRVKERKRSRSRSKNTKIQS